MKVTSTIVIYSVIAYVLLLLPHLSFCQRSKKPNLDIGASLNIGVYDAAANTGVGANIKLLWPLNEKKDALVAGFDLDVLSDVESFEPGEVDYTIALASFGYRKTFNSFFVEPHIGGGLYAEYNYKAACVFFGIEPGFQKKRFAFSLDYRFLSIDDITFYDTFHKFALKLGYRIGPNKNDN